MEGYLDPRNDLVFRRIFGEHPEILRDFLNAMLPLDSPIASLEYLAPDQSPLLPVLKRGIVDVKCKDENGRLFIVEMQVQWTSSFLQRVLFNASQAYVKQLERGEEFELLQPVIALSLLDHVYVKDSPEYYHHYRIVNVVETHRQIEGLEFVFVELPKFRDSHPEDSKRLRWAWIRFLREAGSAGDHGQPTPEDFAKETAINPAIKEALQIARESNFTRRERDIYDRYWFMVSTERSLMSGKLREGWELGMQAGLDEGREMGREEGRQEGLKEGLKEGLREALDRLMRTGMSETEARSLLGLS
jgi:predicted transposase/invertase (TIGR01784 family)